MFTLTQACAVAGTLCLAVPAHADTITIEQALERAMRRPTVAIAKLDVDAARAGVQGAALPLYNPELSADAGPQFGAGEFSPQVHVALAQTIERGGKRTARVDVARAHARGQDIAAGAELLRARVEAWHAFERAVVLRDRLATRREVERLALALATALQQSARAGGTTKLRVNVVVADAGRATQERIVAEAEYAAARAELGTAIGARADEPLEPAGALPELPDVATDVLVQRALRDSPAIAATDNQLALSRARIADADARGTADITLGVGYTYEPDPDGAHAVLGSVALPLAIRNRNQGERTAARIAARRAEAERAYIRTELERRVRLAVDNYRHARAAVAGFDREVIERLNDNLAAAQDAFAKGGLDFVELTTTQRDLIASRIAFLDAQLALVDAWAALALATTLEVKP